MVKLPLPLNVFSGATDQEGEISQITLSELHRICPKFGAPSDTFFTPHSITIDIAGHGTVDTSIHMDASKRLTYQVGGVIVIEDDTAAGPPPPSIAPVTVMSASSIQPLAPK